VALTVAPSTAAPALSVTLPAIKPVPPWHRLADACCPSAMLTPVAACAVAAELGPQQLVLTVLPDTGERYLSLG